MNTTAYHPQTDGLVERYNRTLTAMLAKTAERGGRDWDHHLPYVLFAFRACQQQSTQESPFFLLYGRDPRLPTDAALSPSSAHQQLDLQEYGIELVEKLSGAWELAKNNVKKAQRKQKVYYDRKTKQPQFAVGERVFLLKPSEKTGKNRKFARPFHGPYRIVEINPSNASIRRVDKPQEEPILVALSRLRRCPDEIPDEFWPADATKPKRGRPRKRPPAPMDTTSEDELSDDPELALVESSPLEPSTEVTPPGESQPSPSSKWAGRLRGHSRGHS